MTLSKHNNNVLSRSYHSKLMKLYKPCNCGLLYVVLTPNGITRLFFAPSQSPRIINLSQRIRQTRVSACKRHAQHPVLCLTLACPPLAFQKHERRDDLVADLLCPSVERKCRNHGAIFLCGPAVHGDGMRLVVRDEQLTQLHHERHDVCYGNSTYLQGPSRTTLTPLVLPPLVVLHLHISVGRSRLPP